MSSPFPPYLAEATPLAGITRCIRQICLLREQDNITEAERVEKNEFANTLRDLRLAHGPEFLPESELRGIDISITASEGGFSFLKFTGFISSYSERGGCGGGFPDDCGSAGRHAGLRA